MRNIEIEKIMKKQGYHCSSSIKDIHNAASVERMSEIYFYYIKQCIEKNFPTLDMLREFKDEGVELGIYIDQNGVYKAKEKNSINGDSEIIINTDEFEVSRIWLRDNSSLTINAKANSVVFLYCLNQSKANIKSKDNARVYVNLYHNSFVESKEGNVFITKKDYYGSK